MDHSAAHLIEFSESSFEVETGSTIAHELLSDWDKALSRIS